MNFKPNGTNLIVLGGLGEVGKNMYAVMHEDEIIIIDAGISFPEGDILGVDYVIPDYTFLKQNQSKIKALIITHGHEDHIGAIPFLLQSLDVPAIYAPNQAKELIELKLIDRGVKYNNLFVYNDTTILNFKHIKVEFFRTTHSIPDSHGIYITTPSGTIVTTGDFKFDLTPIGPVADLHKMADIGRRGVDLLISDSTNALNEGFSMSESKVDNALGDVFAKYNNNRLIIATFASNIYRLKHIVETCFKYNRKLCIFGRSMENNIQISLKGGYINHKELFVTPEEANNLKPGEVAILCTGSQGEPLAALSRIADGTHRQIKNRPDDIVIFSSSVIPGNALSISRIINKLYLRGVKVFTNTSLEEIHTSGHASAEELKLMIRLLMPKNLMPFHGDYRMLKAHQNIGIDCGLAKENTFILKNGDVLEINNGNIKKCGEVPASEVYIEGNKVGEIKDVIIRDRKIMSGDGILVVIVNIDFGTKKLLIKPNITTRGFIMVNENEEVIKNIEAITINAVYKKFEDKNLTAFELKNYITSEIYPYIYELTGRKPIILPVIIEPKKTI